MSILFIMMMVIFAVFVATSYRSVKKHEKHDRILFAFAQIESDVMKEIFRLHDSGALGRREYESAQLLLEMLDKIARHYDQHKTTMFNLRTMRRMIEQDLTHYQEARQKVQARLSQVPPNTKIAALYDTFSQAMATAFLAYTPFIRTEIILRLLWADIAAQVAKIQQEQKMLDGRIA